MVKEALGPSAFYGLGEPKIFITDNAPALINALHTTWPSSTKLLCLFHILQQVINVLHMYSKHIHFTYYCTLIFGNHFRFGNGLWSPKTIFYQVIDSIWWVLFKNWCMKQTRKNSISQWKASKKAHTPRNIPSLWSKSTYYALMPFASGIKGVLYLIWSNFN